MGTGYVGHFSVYWFEKFLGLWGKGSLNFEILPVTSKQKIDKKPMVPPNCNSVEYIIIIIWSLTFYVFIKNALPVDLIIKNVLNFGY